MDIIFRIIFNFLLFLDFYNLPIIPQTKNPTNVGLDVVERVNLFK
jgi:hypothetical protein